MNEYQEGIPYNTYPTEHHAKNNTNPFCIGQVQFIEVIVEPDKAEFIKDQPVIVWDDGHDKGKRYFSHMDNGKFACYRRRTSFTTDVTILWDNCRAATHEEIETGVINDEN